MQRRDLWYEASVFERLVYKNRNQHRSSLHFQHILEVIEMHDNARMTLVCFNSGIDAIPLCTGPPADEAVEVSSNFRPAMGSGQPYG